MLKKHPVKYVTKAQLKRAGVNLSTFPNAGPRANVTGMKRLFWGLDATVLKHGAYIYKVPPHIYDKF